MATTIRGITYNKGDSFVCAAEGPGYAQANGSGATSRLTVGNTYYFHEESAGYSYPYLVKISASSTTFIGWFDETVFPYAQYIVTLNANGGSCNVTTQKAQYGQPVTLPTPTRSGYKFLGWATSANAASGVTTYTPTSDITLYAIWEALGLVYIDNGNGFEAYQCYVDNGTSWDLYAPHIDNGASWDLYS